MTKSKQNIYFMQFEVLAQPQHIDAKQIAGAICNCWMQADSEQDAIDKGKHFFVV